MDEELILKAIAFGYELGCRSAETGTVDDPEEEAKANLDEFMEYLKKA